MRREVGRSFVWSNSGELMNTSKWKSKKSKNILQNRNDGLVKFFNSTIVHVFNMTGLPDVIDRPSNTPDRKFKLA